MSKHSSVTRRKFFSKGGGYLSFIIFSVALYPVIRFLGFKVPSKPRKVKVNKVIPDGGFVLNPEFVLFSHDEKQWAVSRKCTHLGCRLNINENEKLLVCPCHQSKFNFMGKRLAGPAQVDLTLYSVQKLNDGYIVSL